VSDRPMTGLLRKAGIVDKHIKEFERWRIADPTEESDKSAHLMVEDLLEDIEKTLDQEPVMKQTLVAPIHTKEPPRLWYAEEETFYAVKDEMGRLITNPDVGIMRGARIWCETAPDDIYVAIDIETLYENDDVNALMMTLEKE
jgi:hypothetical protein